MDRSILQKEPVDGQPRAQAAVAAEAAPLGENPVFSRRVSVVNPRSFIEGVRVEGRGLLGNASATATGTHDRPGEILRASVPPLDLHALVAWLIVVKAEDRPVGSLISLRPFLWAKGEATIGRETADIKFANQALSKCHLGIRLDESGQACTVRDLDSTNGSFIATELGAPYTQLTTTLPLRDGNTLRMGDVLLLFRCFRGATAS